MTDDPTSSPADADRLAGAAERALAGNVARVGDKLERQGKLFVRDRLDLLLDAGSFSEDALLANASAQDLPADGVVTVDSTNLTLEETLETVRRLIA